MAIGRPPCDPDSKRPWRTLKSISACIGELLRSPSPVSMLFAKAASSCPTALLNLNCDVVSFCSPDGSFTVTTTSVGFTRTAHLVVMTSTSNDDLCSMPNDIVSVPLRPLRTRSTALTVSNGASFFWSKEVYAETCVMSSPAAWRR